ncbi:MAG: hypothetical protein ACKN9F_01465 [Methylomonas sp.]
MKQLHGLEKLRQKHVGMINTAKLAEILIDDLRYCECTIYGCIGDEQIVLAKLSLLPETLNYERFDQRLDLNVEGKILRNDCVPLTYCLKGELFSMTGRCSIIARVCGVDLYLCNHYSEQIGDTVRQRFSLSIPALLKRINAV